MALKAESRWQKLPYLSIGCILFLISVLIFYRSKSTAPHESGLLKSVVGQAWQFSYPRDANYNSLSDTQCSAAFPILYDEIARATNSTDGDRITFEEIDSIKVEKGYMRAMIYDHQLYVLGDGAAVYSRSFAVLLAIYRAILTRSPGTIIPNIEFVFNVDDRHTPAPLWAFTRNTSDTLAWLMPDFGFWSWPEVKVGAYNDFVHEAIAMEESSVGNPSGIHWDWEHKREQIMWRGATMDLEQRLGLLAYTRGKSWADVKILDWNNEESMSQDLKSMPEHCQYKFLAHTEGNSYSGRLKYLQNCRSVVISHPQEWITHVSHLMDATPGGVLQNYVEVTRNFSTLESRIKYLLENDDFATRIADNSVRIFRERYLTPAAETCYWRRLFRAWREASFEPELFEDAANGHGRRIRGLPFETYILERRMEWDPY